MAQNAWQNRIVGQGEESPDWRGFHNVHLVNKGMGGDPKGLRKETIRICARCHARRHGIREVESEPMWGKILNHKEL